jgi:tetratricopeptide (TPR) repeat protein
MAFFSKLFSKSADDFLAKGERLFEQERYFEARSVYEDGLQRHISNNNGGCIDSMSTVFRAKIELANKALAELNINEASHAVSSGNYNKAAEHIELAKTLTNDSQLREKAESLLVSIAQNSTDDEIVRETKRLRSPGGSCHSCSSAGPEIQADIHHDTPNLSPLDYYDLLIRQLPGEMYSQYSILGEKFAYMYLAVSKDEHEKALELLEDWFEGSFRDIYYYEKGMILHRLGNVQQAEKFLLNSIAENKANPLPYLGMALLLVDSERLVEAADHLDAMIAADILKEHAILLRGDVFQLAGNFDEAIKCYGMLLTTIYTNQAAEKIYAILIHCGRQQEAEVVFKRYLKGCKH